MADVSVTFTGEMDSLRRELSGVRGEVQSWGKQVAAVGVGAFASWGASQLIEGVVGAWRAGITAVTSFLKDAFAEATSGIQGDAKLDTLVKNLGSSAAHTSEQLKAFANDLAAVTTFDDDSIKQAEMALLRFGVIGRETFADASKAALDLATFMGTDASAAANTLGRAMAQPDKAAMLLSKSVGLSTAAMEELNAQIAAAASDGEKQAAILAMVAKTVGGMAEEAAKSAGGMQQLANQWADVKEEAGRALLPILNEMLPGIKFVLEEVGAAIVETTKHFAELIMEFGQGQAGAETMGEAVVVVFAHIEKAISKVWARAIQFHEALKMIGRIGQWTPAGFVAGKITGVDFSENRKALNQADEIINDTETGAEAGQRRLQQFRDRQAEGKRLREERQRLMSSPHGMATMGIGAGAAVAILGQQAAMTPGLEQAALEKALEPFRKFGTTMFGPGAITGMSREKWVKEDKTDNGKQRERELDNRMREEEKALRERLTAEQQAEQQSRPAAFEDAETLFKRIQGSAASPEKIAKDQLTELQKIEAHLTTTALRSAFSGVATVPVLGP